MRYLGPSILKRFFIQIKLLLQVMESTSKVFCSFYFLNYTKLSSSRRNQRLTSLPVVLPNLCISRISMKFGAFGFRVGISSCLEIF